LFEEKGEQLGARQPEDLRPCAECGCCPRSHTSVATASFKTVKSKIRAAKQQMILKYTKQYCGAW